MDSEKTKFTKSYKGSFRMSKRSPKLVEEKLEVVHLLLNQEQSVGQLSKQYQVSKQTIQFWKMKYEKSGIDGLRESRIWKNYSSELKGQAVFDYLDSKGSLTDICQEFDISSHSCDF